MALARTAVHQTDGLTLASLIARGLRLTIKHLERQRGRRFRPQTIQLPAGRPRTRHHNPVATRKKEG
jgi:peptide subunit release factor 1 (eRF1)